MDEISDEALQRYIAIAYKEMILRQKEDEILLILKSIEEETPQNAIKDEWLEYSNFIVKRRSKK